MPDLDRLADKKLAGLVADGGRLRALVLELWQRTRMDWGFVTDRLATTFRRERWIGAHERRFVSEAVYGLVRHLRRVDLALARARRTQQAPRDLERLLALLVLEGLIDPARAARAEPGLDWAAAAGVDEAIAAERKLPARIALAASLPDWLAARLVADWGEEAEGLARALNERAPMTVRANLLVTGRDELAAELARAGLATHPGRWCATALIVDSRTNLFALEAFQRGAMEAQDEGSQLLAELAIADAPRPLVIDYCAGAGGKTLAIAARLGNRGRIVATDVDAGKLEELRRRARRAKVSCAQAVAIEDGGGPPEARRRAPGSPPGRAPRRKGPGPAAGPTATRKAPGPAPDAGPAHDAPGPGLDALRGKADVVFVDAPCSGIGALRRNPEARWRLKEADVAGFAARQREILAAAMGLAAPGGRIVYGTCSLLAAENGDVVEGVLAAHPELAPVALANVLGEERARALGDGDAFVVRPDRHGTDGFYARVMKRV